MALTTAPDNTPTADALNSFLLSVVLIDDHAAFSPENNQVPEANGHGLNAKAIVDAFADRGMVCGVLKPTEDEDIVDRAQKATRRADVVMLDWVLKDGDEEGELARGVLRALLTEEDAQHMLRFFVIYTGTPRLREIAAHCKGLLKSLNAADEVVEYGEFTLSMGPVTLSIFAKDTVPEFEDPTLEERRSRPADLPAKLLEDYRRREPGMVESAALRSVALVRLHTHHLLARFPREVDAGYMWHRARLPNQEDGATHIVEMIGAEITDLLDSPLVRCEVSKDAALRWIESRKEMLSRVGQFEEDKTASLDDIKQIVQSGADTAKANGVTLPKAFKSDGHKSELPTFAVDGTTMKESHELLSMLMTLRDREAKPLLRSGVFVEADGEFLLCVQPLCDSTRLEKEKAWFPFLRLAEPNDSNKNRFNIIIPVDDGKPIRRQIPKKASSIVMLEFPTTDGAVGAEGDPLAFCPTTGPPIIYRATLRPMKAVSVITSLASSLSRTGIDDPEWLRGWSG